MPATKFPKSFLWGCAASAYQIEGAVDADGRMPSTWDEFCTRPGAIWEGQSGRVACDHYHRWEEDLDLIARIGFQSYRFSTAWPRILPEGTGRVNPLGLDFYDRLTDGLLARGIKPMLCLHHWDLPLTLEKRGGWRKRETAKAFGEYASCVARRLGDRVHLWAPFNEIPVIIHEGFTTGNFPPGAKESQQVIRQVAHHLLLAHGLAVQAIRAEAKTPEVGLIHNSHVPLPFSEHPDDVDAARRRCAEKNGWLLDAIFRGRYPEAERRRLGANAPKITPGDMKIISQPLDYFGLNFYFSPEVVHADGAVRPVERHFPRTDTNWPITEDGIYWGLRWHYDLYKPPVLYVTENGCGFPDKMTAEGRVDDYARIAYLRSHLRMTRRALDDGLPVRGYFIWSILDNFEWACGYSKRFGLVHVNYETLQRTPKASAEWVSRVIRDNGF